MLRLQTYSHNHFYSIDFSLTAIKMESAPGMVELSASTTRLMGVTTPDRYGLVDDEVCIRDGYTFLLSFGCPAPPATVRSSLLRVVKTHLRH
jgi:hypothetical protein